MRIVVATYMHGRFDMYGVQAMCVQRLVRDFGVIPVVVCSRETPNRAFVDSCGFNYYEYRNKPLGEKANFTAIVSSFYNPDYIIFLDADDIIDNGLMKEYIKYMKKGYDVIGTKDIYFYSLNHKRVKYGVFGHWAGYETSETRNTGVAKCLSKRALTHVDWRPFNRRVNSGLDGTMRARVSRCNPKIIGIRVRANNLFCVDVKTLGNINGIGNFDLDIMDPRATMSRYLPREEVEAIMNLRPI